MPKNSNCIKICVLILSLLCFSSTGDQNSFIFSRFNRFNLSTDALLFARSSLEDSTLSPWFSYLLLPVEERGAFQFIASGQRVGVDIGAVAGMEYLESSNRFGALSGKVFYRSKFLDAYIITDVYSTERRINPETQDIQFERFIKENAHEPITGMFDFRVNLPVAFLEAKLKYLTLSIGKQKLRWGPGYKGTLGLSGTAYSPFYYYNLNLQFADFFHAGAFLCGYDDESIYSSELELKDTLKIKSTGRQIKTGFPRYGAGQRLDVRIGKHLQIGIYELVDFFGANELTRFANPLQIYYLSNESSGTNNANLLGGMDINLILGRFRIYGDFLNDDITVFEHTGNPNKYAYQAGAVYYGRGMLVESGVEYTHVSRYVYSHSKILSRHGHWGESMGWPWGNDMDLFHSRAVFAFPRNVYGKVELNYWIRGKGGIEDDWYADGKPDLDHAPYWPQFADRRVTGIVGVEYKPLPWINTALFYEPVWKKGGFENGINFYLEVSVPGRFEYRVEE
jgi:hypothetical protein